MNFKSQALELQEFLLQYSPIWNQEVMNEYPNTIPDYPAEWLDLLDKLTREELFAIDSKQSFTKIAGTSLYDFLLKIQKISHIEAVDESPELPLEDWAFAGVKLKKRHEIQKIVPEIKKIHLQHKIHHLNDIGGGVGHLSRILAHYHSIPAFSIDQNKEFQATGEKRLKRFRKIADAAEVTFINMKFGEENKINDQVFSPDSFSLGLHTCGNLALKLIETSVHYRTRGLLSFGCCYHLIRHADDSNFYQSEFYRQNNFQKINLYGLSLATRSHAETNFQNYIKKEKVKNYRYGFHLFMMKHFNRNDYIDVGECPLQVYDQPISQYILLKLAVLEIPHSYAKEYIENFYYSKQIQTELRTMFLCNIIRWQIGRALEVFLLLDRCLMLTENGYQVTIKQFFTEELSPRNIGILALSK
jgi:hypothetical protein